jgi:hypothetical protein
MGKVNSETPMTAQQIETLRSLAGYAGAGPVTVQTSYYDQSGRGVALFPDDWKPVAIGLKMTTLRGLEKRGKIRIVAAYWRGATVEVLP